MPCAAPWGFTNTAVVSAGTVNMPPSSIAPGSAPGSAKEAARTVSSADSRKAE